MTDAAKSIQSILRSITILLVVILALESYQAWVGWKTGRERVERRTNLEKALKDIEQERQKIFQDYSDALNAPETQSIMHQQYHANNVQIRLQNLAIQQEQIFAMQASR